MNKPEGLTLLLHMIRVAAILMPTSPDTRHVWFAVEKRCNLIRSEITLPRLATTLTITDNKFRFGTTRLTQQIFAPPFLWWYNPCETAPCTPNLIIIHKPKFRLEHLLVQRKCGQGCYCPTLHGNTRHTSQSLHCVCSEGRERRCVVLFCVPQLPVQRLA